MGLLGEVISMTEVARGLHYTKLRQTEIELNVSRIMQNEARNAVLTAQSEYSRALKAIPAGLKALLLDLGRAIIGIVASFGKGTAKGQNGGSAASAPSALANSQSLAFARLLSDTLGHLSGAFSSFEAFKITFGAYQNSLAAGGQNDLKTQVSNLIQQSIKVCNGIVDLVKNSFGSGKSIESFVATPITNRISSLINEVKPLVVAEALNGANVPPVDNTATTASSSTDSSGSERFAAHLASERLQAAEKRYDSIFVHLKQQQQEMGKLMAKIAGLDLTRRTVEPNGTLEPFIEKAALAGNAGSSKEDHLFYVDLLKTQAVEIHKQSFAGLGKMLTAENDRERSRLLQELNQQSQGAQEKVIELVNQRKAIYTAAINKRRQELDDFVNQLGGPETNNTKAIDSAKNILDLN
ncbi:unnamed protein product [Rotaria socialis]|uniref:Uncharacterized protein n=1 Tax=Rotaria socialis TaxID=392032 RepID=A0A820YBW1_9BILA|nr:unnamed protein product [Rotaria socialis]CAF4322431.1 unnamed protein product [Rotaria socialis]CAF4545918.1 unnamed protein product [Rotaria socialis]CAF4693244.1 unnamed protein product [Rotaria socialis]